MRSALVDELDPSLDAPIIDQVNVTKIPDGDGSATSSSYNGAEMRLMRAEMLRLTDSVGQLNAELKRTHRNTTKKHHFHETTHHDGLSPVRSALVDELDPSLDAPTPPQEETSLPRDDAPRRPFARALRTGRRTRPLARRANATAGRHRRGHEHRREHGHFHETTHHDGLSPVRSALVDELDPSLDAPTPPQAGTGAATNTAANTAIGQDQ